MLLYSQSYWRQIIIGLTYSPNTLYLNVCSEVSITHKIKYPRFCYNITARNEKVLHSVVEIWKIFSKFTE